MKFRPFALVATLAAAGACTLFTATAAFAQAKEQFFPALVYRTGAYAPNGVPFANGYIDYFKLINAKGASTVSSSSGKNARPATPPTAASSAMTAEGQERRSHGVPAAVHRHHLRADRQGARRQGPADHRRLWPQREHRRQRLQWNFPLTGTYWDAADILIQHVGKKEGGLDKLKGKKIALVYHDSPYGKEPIPLLEERAKQLGFTLQLLPVTHPGVEQKATWLQIRQNRPDYVFLWGWGVMNSTALKEAVATGYPRDKMYGVWWAAAEPDVKDVGDGAKATTAWRCSTVRSRTPRSSRTCSHRCMPRARAPGQRKKSAGAVHARPDRGHAGGRGCQACPGRYGKGKVMTGEQARWGYENLALDQKMLDARGLRRRDAADQHLLRRPTAAPRLRACTPGTAASGCSARTGSRLTSRSSSR